MASTFKWAAGWTSRSTVLTTELNSLAAAGVSVAGTEIDNSTNLDVWGQLKLSVTFGSAPTAGGYVNLYMVTAPDGTNYEDSGTVTPIHRLVASLPVRAVNTAQILNSKPIILEPGKTKFYLENVTSQAFPASASTVTLYTANEGSV